MKSSKRTAFKGWALAATLAGSLLAGVGNANAAATIIINNINAAGVGFNDTTPAAPVGGNTGTTLGEQRLIAFTYAANLWGATLTSSVPIVINAQFSALTCTATSAVLGSAGTTFIFRNFANAPKPDTWYSYALANKLAGVDVSATPSPQINANFNANLGTAGCLTGTFFYLGLDGNHGASTDFVEVLLHEMGHGIGFQTFTNGTTGAFNGGFPAIWDHYLFAAAAGKTWKDATAAERAASAISVNGLVWTGPLVTAAVPSVLRLGTAALIVSGAGAGAAAGTYTVGEASFGTPINGSTPVTAQIMPVAAQTAGAGSGCEAFSENNIKAVRNRIALIDRGTCGFVVKVKNAQNAGAVGVIIADNAAGAPPPGLGGSDPTITIPAVRITLDDGNKLKLALQTRSRVASGVIGSLTTVGSQYAGADALGRILMYAPNPFQGGSSVSHYDVSAFRNQLMEPAINGDLTQSVIPPQDLTFKLLQDIGW
jgi:PA domain